MSFSTVYLIYKVLQWFFFLKNRIELLVSEWWNRSEIKQALSEHQNVHISQLNIYQTFKRRPWLVKYLFFSLLLESTYSSFSNKDILMTAFRKKFLVVFTNTRNDLKRLETRWNQLKPSRNCLKSPETTWNQPCYSIF